MVVCSDRNGLLASLISCPCWRCPVARTPALSLEIIDRIGFRPLRTKILADVVLSGEALLPAIAVDRHVASDDVEIALRERGNPLRCGDHLQL